MTLTNSNKTKLGNFATEIDMKIAQITSTKHKVIGLSSGTSTENQIDHIFSVKEQRREKRGCKIIPRSRRGGKLFSSDSKAKNGGRMEKRNKEK